MFVKEFLRKRLILKRERLFSKKIKTIKNPDVSILCNCCIGGCFYHDAKARFLSPTINLYFEHHGFIDYVRHLDSYVNKGYLLDTGKKEDGAKGPIGVLKCDGLPDIYIHFLHYNDFETASEKWIDRSKRINYKKIFLVIEAKDEHEHELINEYLSLPFPSVIFTNIEGDGHKVLHMRFYEKHKTKPITSFVGLSGKKGFDDYDFIKSIFNYDFL